MLTPLHTIIIVDPFVKWGIDFMTFNRHLVGWHGYISVAVDHFTKCSKVMPTFNNTGKTTTYFFLNHVIIWFGVLRAIVMDHGKDF